MDNGKLQQSGDLPAKELNCAAAEDDLFVSPVKKSIRVKMKFKIGGRVKVLPVDESDAVYFD